MAQVQLDDLPEDVLQSIVSRITMQESARNSILSRKWRHAWHGYPHLTFDGTTFPGNILELYLNSLTFPERETVRNQRAAEFVNYVDCILDRHWGHALETLKINAFYLDARETTYLDKWISFAADSRAKNIFLRITLGMMDLTRYTFLTNILAPYLESICLFYMILRPDIKFGGFKNLKILELDCVDVSGNGLQSFLSESLLLERLELKYCRDLTCIKISHSLNNLRNLVVESCDLLETIELHVRGLADFKFAGEPVRFLKLRDSSWSMIADICLMRRDLEYVISEIPRDLPRIETLVFEAWCESQLCVINSKITIWHHFDQTGMFHTDTDNYQNGIGFGNPWC